MAKRSASSWRRSCSEASAGTTLYVLDEPTTGLHAADVDTLVVQLDRLVESGNTVIVVEHDMRVAAASDYVIDIGPGAGGDGGRVVASGAPAEVANAAEQPHGALPEASAGAAATPLTKELCTGDGMTSS